MEGLHPRLGVAVDRLLAQRIHDGRRNCLDPRRIVRLSNGDSSRLLYL